MTPSPRRPMNALNRLVERFAYTRVGAWLVLNVASRLDPPLSRLTGGRFTTALLLGLPLTLLTTTGAKTGLPRSVALISFTDGDALILIASSAGSARHPGWYHNLCAHPQAQVTVRGKTAAYVAREAEGEERARLWQRACALYAGYETYAQRAAGRRIPVMVLSPVRQPTS